MNSTKYLAFFVFSLISIIGFTQSVTIKGNIKDATTKEPLIGVNIVEKDGNGTVTDFEGNYELVLEGKENYEITISYLGYADVIKSFSNEQTNYIFDVNLEEAAVLLGDEVVITGSLFEKKASEEVISIEVVKPDLIANVNPTRIDEALRRVSGLNVSDGQANIRAGSGWAYGVGSRVMFILDGQPVLSPDRGDIKWNQLPLESVGQIEVLKGASSVLYGSSAMNGTIHLQTLKPTKTPLTKFTAFQSFIAPPKRRETKWWDFPIPTFGASFVRAHKSKDNFEYLVGGSFFLQNTPYEGGEEYLARIYYKTKWTSKKNERISYGVNGSLLYNREYEYFFWQNEKDGAYKAGAENDFNNIRITVDPFLKAFDKKENIHDFKTRTYYNQPSFNTTTLLENIDYSFTKPFQKIGLNLILGTSDQMFFVRVPAFIGNEVKFGNLWAVFAQLDKKFGDKVTLSGGIRWEVYKYATEKGIIPPNSRFGVNWKAAKNTNLRFNVGQAFRFPSFAERFVNEKLGEQADTANSPPLLRILPNPNLKPEYGWTSELGIQQKFGTQNNKYSSLFDFAFYWQEYKDMVDFGGADSVTDALISLQAKNVSKARIAGWDMSFKNNFIINEKNKLSLNLGYTYAFPIELNSDAPNPEFDNTTVGGYIKNMFKYFVKPVSGINIYQMLKYRNRHLATFDVEYKFNDKLLLGFDVRYYSKFENYDLVFLGIDGVPEYLNNFVNPNGSWVANARIFYTFKEKNTLGVIAKNITNTEYWLRVGRLETPMNFTIQYRMEF